jgi:hypothetical protein
MTTAGTPTPIPIFASFDSPSFGLSADGAVVAVAVGEGGFVVGVLVDVRTRVSNDVGTRVVSSISSSLTVGSSSHLRLKTPQNIYYSMQCCLFRSRNCHRHSVRLGCILVNDLAFTVSDSQQEVCKMMHTISVP